MSYLSSRWGTPSIHFLLPLFFLCEVFGPGLQTIPLLAVLQLPIEIFYARFTSYWCLIPLIITKFIGLSIAFVGLLVTGADDNRYSILSVTIVGMASMIYTLLFCSILTLDKIFYNRFSDRTGAHLLVFPTLFTAMWYLITQYSFSASWGNHGYVLYHWRTLMMSVSIFGLPGLNFLIGWFATSLLWLAGTNSHSRQGDFTYTRLYCEDNDLREHSQCTLSNSGSELGGESSRRHKGPGGWAAGGFLIFFLIFLLYGECVILLRYGTFYNKSTVSIVPDAVRVACVIPGSDTELGLARTVQEAHAGAKIVLWPEIVGQMDNETQANDLIGRARRTAQSEKIYLGVTYHQKGVNANHTGKNMFIFITPNGTVAWKYQKAFPVGYPVFNMEDSTPGPHIIPTVDTPYGRIGGAICYDMDYPSYISQTAKDDVDIFLQPSATWGPITWAHYYLDSVRAAEQGFSTIRCSRDGVSGIFDSNLQNYATRQLADNGTMVGHLPIRKRVKTPYSTWGNVMAYVTLALSLVWIGIIALPDDYLMKFRPFQWWLAGPELAI